MQKVHKCAFCTFYLAFALVVFLFWSNSWLKFPKEVDRFAVHFFNFLTKKYKKCTFLMRSVGEWAAIATVSFCTFWPKVLFFGLYALCLKSAKMHFLKRDGAKVADG